MVVARQPALTLPLQSRVIWTRHLPIPRFLFFFNEGVYLCQPKKTTQPESWELCFIWVGVLLRTRAWEIALQFLWGTAPKRRGGSQDKLEFCWGKMNKHVVEHQKVTSNHKRWMSQFNDFSAFLCRGRCRDLGSWNTVLHPLSWLPRAGILFFSILNSLRADLSGQLLWLLVGWWAAFFVYWNSREHGSVLPCKG